MTILVVEETSVGMVTLVAAVVEGMVVEMMTIDLVTVEAPVGVVKTKLM